MVEPLPGRCAPPRGWRTDRRRSRRSTSPTSLEDRGARHRLAFEELFLLELALVGRKQARAERAKARELPGTGELVDPWLAALPFVLTSDQRRAIDHINRDIAETKPMQRLLMGEVGSGQDCVRPGKRCCAPSRAARRPRSWRRPRPSPSSTWRRSTACSGATFLSGYSRRDAARRRKELLDRLASSELGMIVGAHALIEPAVEFRALGPGRRRRAASLRRPPAGGARREGQRSARPARAPHDRDSDPADARAHGLRRPRRDGHARAAARAAPDRDARRGRRASRARAYERIREEIAKGRQCFVVCPLVEESETLQAKAATAEAERLPRPSSASSGSS